MKRLTADELKGIRHCVRHAIPTGAVFQRGKLLKELDEVTRERDEARALVRGVESEDGNFGLIEHVQRWNAEKERA